MSPTAPVGLGRSVGVVFEDTGAGARRSGVDMGLMGQFKELYSACVTIWIYQIGSVGWAIAVSLGFVK